MKKSSSLKTALLLIIILTALKPAFSEDFMTNKIGNTGIRVGIVALKILPYENNSKEAFNLALSKGVNLIDVSPEYQGAENFVSENLGYSRRDKIIIATRWKVLPGMSEDQYISQFNKSIRNLNTNTIDLVIIDNIQELKQLEGNACINAFRQLKKDGKTRYFGINIKNTKGQAQSILKKAIGTGDYEFIVINYSTFNFKNTQTFIEYAGRKGLGIIVENTVEEVEENPDKLRRIIGRRKMPLESAVVNWAANSSKWISAILVPNSDMEKMKLYIEGGTEEDW